LLDLIEHRPHDVARRREAETGIGTGCRRNQRVQTDETSLRVDEWTAAVAGIDRRVGLHVDHWRVGLELPRDRADDTERHRVLQAQRAAERQHHLSRP
jgi:hypothetical protein